MSFIRFQDLHGSVTLPGRARPRLLRLVHHLASDFLHRQAASTALATLHDLLPDNHYLKEMSHQGAAATRFGRAYAEVLWSILDEPIVAHRGQTIRPLTLILNTAMELGSDPVRLAARLHGQCEINCWVSGPHRRWLADVIGTGLHTGLYPDGCGWENLQRFLQDRDDLPAVTSYSEDFPTLWTAADPDASTTALGDEGREAVWENLPAQQRWRWGMHALNCRREEQLEITPDWADYRFDAGISLGDLLAPDSASRLDRAFQMEPSPSC
jgi:hypothetical protein